MRHKLSGRKLNRTSSHRKAMFMNMSNSFFEHEQIKTTLPKAKDLRGIVERYITMAKKDPQSLHTRRTLLSRLNNNNDVVTKLVTTLAERYKKRPGGYTRIVKAGFRYGDSAPMAVIELVDRPRDSVVNSNEGSAGSQVIDQAPPKEVSATGKKASSKRRHNQLRRKRLRLLQRSRLLRNRFGAIPS